MEAWGEVVLMHSTVAAERQCCIMAPPGLSSKSPASLKVALSMAVAPLWSDWAEGHHRYPRRQDKGTTCFESNKKQKSNTLFQYFTMVSVIPQLSRVWRSSYKFQRVSVLSQNPCVLCLPAFAAWSFKTAQASLCWISSASAPLENIPCAHCISPDFILIPNLQVQI